MKSDGKGPLIVGLIIIILGVLIIPNIATLIFGSSVCAHSNMYLVGLAIILIGIYLVLKEIKTK
jgi:hypothetical protein